MSKKTNTKIVLIVVVLLIFIGGFAVDHFNKTYLYSNTIARNIYIEGIDVSNQTKEKAKELIIEVKAPKNIVLQYEDKTYEISPDEIDLKYDLDDVIDEAYKYTKTESYFENVKRYFDLKKNKVELEITPSYDEVKLSEAVNKIQDEINVEMVNAKVWISDFGSMSYSPSITGKELDLASTKETIYDMIESKEFKNIDLKVNTKEPNLSTKQAKSVNSLLAEFTTKFSTSDPNRVENITTASKKISNTLLMPGEEFSYNNLTGRRTKSNGYKDAPVIVNGILEEGVGGGVCQVSTTIFNTAMYSGMNITSRNNHSLKSSYVPVGQDAMVSDSWSDFRFKNPYDHPIYVKVIVGNGSVTCKIYGNSSDKKNISIKVDQFKENGKSAAKTYVQYRDSNGNITETKYIAKSVYKD